MELSWIALIGGAVLAGAAVVAVLIARPLLELPLAAIVVGGLTTSFLAFTRILRHYDTTSTTVWALAFLFAGMVGGYALASTLLHLLAPKMQLPHLPDDLPDDLGSPAVLVVACDEPESYRPGLTAGMLQGLAEEGVLDVSVGALPLLFFAQKTRYRALGGVNPAASQLSVIAEDLRGTMRSGPTVATVCSWPGGLAKAVGEAVLRGHRSIVVAELSVGESSAMRAMVEELEALHLSSLGIEVLRTGALWHSDRIIGMVAGRIARAVADPHVTGVVLVGHGQPPQIADRNPGMDEEETRFLSRVRMHLVDTGISAERIHIAWTDWGEPDVTTSVRHLVAAGCSRVIVSPSVYPLDTLATGLDLEIAVRQARVDQSASIVTLSPWKNDPAVIEELRARVVDVLSI